MSLSTDAVSESIGYVLIIGLVFTGSGLVSLYGYPLIQEKKLELTMNSVARELIRVTSDMNDMVETGRPVSYESFLINDGSLFLEDAGADMGTFVLWQGGKIVFSYHPGALHYMSNTDGNEVFIENGACIERTSTLPLAMLSRPRAYYDRTRKVLILPLIQLVSADMRTTSGYGRIVIRLNGSPRMYEFSNTPNKVTISYEAPKEHDTSSVWKDYFHYSLRMTENFRGYAREDAEKVIVLLSTLSVSRG